MWVWVFALCSPSDNDSMSLSSLPAVLVQTLMHSLDAKSILSFARSSKWIMRSADSAFAWSRCAPMELTVKRDLSPVPQSIFTLRFRPLWVVWSLSSGTVASPSLVAGVIALATSCRTVGFQVDFHNHHDDALARVLSDAAVTRSIRFLGVVGPSAAIMRCAATMPLLDTIYLQGFDQAACDVLTQAPALTSLEMNGICDVDSAFFSWLSRLTHLTHVGLDQPWFKDLETEPTRWLSFCSALARVESVDLLGWGRMARLSVSELAAGFAAMSTLQRLRIRLCDEVGTFLQALLLASLPLHLLTIAPRDSMQPVLIDLMTANSALHVHFEWSCTLVHRLSALFPGRVSLH